MDQLNLPQFQSIVHNEWISVGAIAHCTRAMSRWSIVAIVVKHSLGTTVSLFAQAVDQASFVIFQFAYISLCWWYAGNSTWSSRCWDTWVWTLSTYTHASNTKVNRHKSETILLNGIDITTPFLTVIPGQLVRYLGVFFKDGAIDTHLQRGSMLICQQCVIGERR
jgi:hypothetical protein